MPWDGSQNYQYPPGTPGIPDQTIESVKYNTFLDDLVANDLNAARPITRGGTGATTAIQALTNLGGEKAQQVITNYDQAGSAWMSGSFYSDITATAPPVAGHRFLGLVTKQDDDNIVLEAFDMDSTPPGESYTRVKKAGVWSNGGAWGSGGFVRKIGDTMSGSLDIRVTDNGAELTLSALSFGAADAWNALGYRFNNEMLWWIGGGRKYDGVLNKDYEIWRGSGEPFPAFAIDFESGRAAFFNDIGELRVISKGPYSWIGLETQNTSPGPWSGFGFTHANIVSFSLTAAADAAAPDVEWFGIDRVVAGTWSTPFLIRRSTGYIGIEDTVGTGLLNPRYQVVIRGTGQQTPGLADAGAKGASLLIISADGSAGSGGALLFGAGTTLPQYPQAAIKFHLTNGSGVGIGDLVFSLRADPGVDALTERMRLFVDGSLHTAGGNFQVSPVGTVTANGGVNSNGFNVFNNVAAIYLHGKSSPGGYSEVFGSTAFNQRWKIRMPDESAEDASNSGGNFAIHRLGWNGGVDNQSLGVPFHIRRSDGLVTIQGPGQATANITDAGLRGGMLHLYDETFAGGCGGALLLGAPTTNGARAQGAIKTTLYDGGANGYSNFSFSLRHQLTDDFLTEAMRLDRGGGLYLFGYAMSPVLSLESTNTNSNLHLRIKSSTREWWVGQNANASGVGHFTIWDHTGGVNRMKISDTGEVSFTTNNNILHNGASWYAAGDTTVFNNSGGNASLWLWGPGIGIATTHLRGGEHKIMNSDGTVSWAVINNSGITFNRPVNVPNNATSTDITTYSYQTSGAFGGGYSMNDGGAHFGLHMQSGATYFRFGGSLTAGPAMILFPAGTASSNAATGTLVLQGGVGITGNSNIAGDIGMIGNLNFSGGGSTITGVGARKSAFHAHKNAVDQTGLADQTWVQATFSTAAINTGSNYAANAWTPPAGPVFIGAMFAFTTNLEPNAMSSAAIYKNGSAIAKNTGQNASTQGGVMVCTFDVASGADVYTAWVNVDATAGNTSTISGVWPNTQFFGMSLV